MSAPSVEIRCYCHGLGDCMLLRLPKIDGSSFWMLIDCGVHSAAKGGGDIMKTVVADIATRTGKRLDVIVGTHEHWDHLSAFLQAAEAFDGFTIGEVWFSWAENPADPDARKLDRFKSDTASALAATSLRLADVKALNDTALGINALLGFVFGAKGEKVRDARESLRGLAPVVRHLEPGTLAPLDPVLGLRAYVLGPPRDSKLLGIEDIVSETYSLGAGAPAVAPLANGLALNDGLLRIDDDPAAPFDGVTGIALDGLIKGNWPADPHTARFFWDHYLGPGQGEDDTDQSWRRIDHDWLTSSVDLALQLDGRTNNTSLVLALEIIETGRVLLFAADAQIGSWMSWPAIRFPALPGEEPMTGETLMRRTVFYKVGHHGSRNATRTAGLELMDRANLVAFSPTDESLASRVGWKDFPAPKTSERISQLTSGRFFPSDANWLHDPAFPCPVKTGGALAAYHICHGFYVDLTISGGEVA